MYTLNREYSIFVLITFHYFEYEKQTLGTIILGSIASHDSEDLI